ncbi:MAG: A/G-specific adenine glycosylase [Candidatus Wildermuthbacteria bacterium]|nr:A/G-specific adenine glycosylase [Candidatus Wildermuthbacteria bacterium]
MGIKKFQKIILSWYAKNRRDLPWRNTKDPYKILVSEIMLQQTQVSRVLPKYEEFLKAFPTLEVLSKAPDKKLLKVWQGLGYWRRAKYLKETAKTLCGAKTAGLTRREGSVPKEWVKREEKPQFERNFPKIPEQLEKLPGIGHYTARALACFAFGSREAFLDTNIRRVYLHFFFPNQQDVPDETILPLAQKAIYYISHGRGNRTIPPREWHYALFDYGALVLKDRTINQRSRRYAKQSKFDGSFRSFRTQAVKFLLSTPQNETTHNALKKYIQELLDQKEASYSCASIIDSLLKDGLLKKSPTHYFL